MASCAWLVACDAANPAFRPPTGDAAAVATDAEAGDSAADATADAGPSGLPESDASITGDAGTDSGPEMDAFVETLGIGLAAHYSMDDGSGDLVEDATGGTALAVRPPSTWIAGSTGATGDHALSFAGGYASTQPMPASAAVRAVRDAITIALWMWWAAPRSSDQIVLLHGHRTWELRLGTQGFPRACFVAGDTAFASCGHVDLPTRRWVHVAITWDGVTERQYVDGVDDHPRGIPFAGPILSRPGDMLYLGAWGEGGDPFSGAVDDVRIYSRALAPSEVARLARR